MKNKMLHQLFGLLAFLALTTLFAFGQGNSLTSQGTLTYNKDQKAKELEVIKSIRAATTMCVNSDWTSEVAVANLPDAYQSEVILHCKEFLQYWNTTPTASPYTLLEYSQANGIFKPIEEAVWLPALLQEPAIKFGKDRTNELDQAMQGKSNNYAYSYSTHDLNIAIRNAYTSCASNLWTGSGNGVVEHVKDLKVWLDCIGYVRYWNEKDYITPPFEIWDTKTDKLVSWIEEPIWRAALDMPIGPANASLKDSDAVLHLPAGTTGSAPWVGYVSVGSLLTNQVYGVDDQGTQMLVLNAIHDANKLMVTRKASYELLSRYRALIYAVDDVDKDQVGSSKYLLDTDRVNLHKCELFYQAWQEDHLVKTK